MLEGFQAGLSWLTILQQAGKLPPRLRSTSMPSDRPLRRQGRRAPDGGRRHHAQPRQDRSDDRQREGLSAAHGAHDAQAVSLGLSRQGPVQNRYTTHDATFRPRRSFAAICKASRPKASVSSGHDDLCVHAVDRHGQRSPRELPPPRRLCEAAARKLKTAASYEEAATCAAANSCAPRAPGSACSPGGGSICSIRRRRHRNRGHRARARPRRALERTDARRARVLRRAALLIVEDIADAREPDWPANWRLAALLHDAPEYVIGDLISPFKTAIGLDYKAFEQRLLAAIHARFELPAEPAAEVTGEIKRCDRIAAYYEATRLAGFASDEAIAFFGTPGLPPELRALVRELRPMPPKERRARSSAASHGSIEQFERLQLRSKNNCVYLRPMI